MDRIHEVEWPFVEFPDHFSGVASDYAAFRPQYPAALFDWLASVCQRHDVAWDCACGSGQASRPLASHFGLVIGTDASPTQVAGAEADEKTRFVVAASELAPLADGLFDLVTVGGSSGRCVRGVVLRHAAHCF